MELVVINYISRYEDNEEVVGIALNMDIAKRHVEFLKEQYPYAYGDKCGKFRFDGYEAIEE